MARSRADYQHGFSTGFPRVAGAGWPQRASSMTVRARSPSGRADHCAAALEETVVEAQGVVECVHFVVVEHADPVVQLSDVDAEHLLEEYAAFPAVDLGFWPGKAGPGRGGSGGDGHD